MVRWVSSEQRRVVSLKTDMFTGEQQGGDNVLHFFLIFQMFFNDWKFDQLFFRFSRTHGKVIYLLTVNLYFLKEQHFWVNICL